MGTLITITKILGLVTLCVIFILILLAIFTAPYRNKIEEQQKKEFQDKLIKLIFEEKEEIKEPKKRGRKPKTDKVK